MRLLTALSSQRHRQSLLVTSVAADALVYVLVAALFGSGRWIRVDVIGEAATRAEVYLAGT